MKYMATLSSLVVLLFSSMEVEGGHYTFIVKEAVHSRLCYKNIMMTVNGMFPGPTIYAMKGERVTVDVINHSKKNITIHWHGVRQFRNPWVDGVEYITQCPIQPGANFTQTIQLSTEEGTLLWHAHSKLHRATVYGAFIVYPEMGATYPFPTPDADVPVIIGEWWNGDVQTVYDTLVRTGDEPNIFKAFTVNGQPGGFSQCSSSQETFMLEVDKGKTYLLRLINAALEDIHHFSVANHSFTVIAADASYTKPVHTEYVAIAPGQTIDVLLKANQSPGCYYMAARAYSGAAGGPNFFKNSTTTAILKYNRNYTTQCSEPLLGPNNLPKYNENDTLANFVGTLKSLADDNHPIDVPLEISTRLIIWVSINTFPCPRGYKCAGPANKKLAASLNNISFLYPSVDILRAYNNHLHGVYDSGFPNFPPLKLNLTDEFNGKPMYMKTPNKVTTVEELEYNSMVEIVFLGVNILAGFEHPMHLHGFNFFVVGQGKGDFNPDSHPMTYNLVDPPLRNTVTMPIYGWVAIRFKADNPGVWFMHCHIERHMVWGMDMVFIIKDGNTPGAQLLPPPKDMPPC